MHRSRLAGFIMDCRTDDLGRAAQFWSAALGVPLKPAAEEPSPLYRQLLTSPSDLHIEVQKVEHDSRVHIDIETDDIEAEASRLEAQERAHLVRDGGADRSAVLPRPPAARAVQGARERLEVALGSRRITCI